MLSDIKRYSFFFALLLIAVQTFAQPGDKKVRITTPVNDITGIAKIIAVQTGWRYSLNMQNSSLQKKITLHPGTYTLNKILEQVRIQAKLSYKIVGNHIIFVDYIIKENIAPTTKNLPAKRNKPLPVLKKLPPVPATLPTAVIVQQQAIIDSAIVHKDTLRYIDIVPALIEIHANAPSPKLNAASKDSLYKATIKSEAGNSKSSALRERKQILFAKAGFAVDEIFYANAVLEGGFNFLYGIASFGTTFKTGGFRWGGGISFPLNEDNRLHVTFTTGNMHKMYDFDTFPQLLQLKETLHRFGAAWSRQLNEKIGIQLQLHYNLLLKNYSVDNAAGKPNPLTGDFDKKYYIITPPYTLSKSTGATSVTKSWIGLQCTFFYKF